MNRIPILLLLVSALLLVNSKTAYCQWQQLNGPQGGYIRSILFDGTNIYAASGGGFLVSDDEGITWSIPQVVEHGLKKEGWHSMWPGPGRGTVLSDGRLVVPITVFDFEQFYSYYLFSDDHGKSWDISGNIGTGINEPTLVEIDENKLLVNARNTNRSGKRAIVTSDDRGKTWSEISYHEDLPDPTCQGSCIRIKDKKGKNILVFSNSADPGKRQNM